MTDQTEIDQIETDVTTVAEAYRRQIKKPGSNLTDEEEAAAKRLLKIAEQGTGPDEELAINIKCLLSHDWRATFPPMNEAARAIVVGYHISRLTDIIPTSADSGSVSSL